MNDKRDEESNDHPRRISSPEEVEVRDKHRERERRAGIEHPERPREIVEAREMSPTTSHRGRAEA